MTLGSPALTASRVGGYDQFMATLAGSVTPNHTLMSLGAGDSRASFPKKTLGDSSVSVLDQLHAEQKSTIEALTYQIEFYRQRETRYKKEVDTLRQYLNDGDSGSADTDGFVSRVANENRTLGDEVDALRGKQTAWNEEKRRIATQQQELEQQLQDARLSLTTFTQAIEQLELKVQRKDTEVQTRALEMEQEVRAKSQECEQLERQLRQYQDANDQANREVEQMKKEVQRVRDKLKTADTTTSSQDSTIENLQTQLTVALNDVATLRRDLDTKALEVADLRDQIRRSTEMLALREKMLSADSSSRQEKERQRSDLETRVSRLLQDKLSFESELDGAHLELKRAKQDLDSMKVRLMTKDHGIVVATLRSEVSSLKERLRSEFKLERDTILNEKASLNKEITQLTSRLAEKDRFVHRLQDELTLKDSAAQQATLEISTLNGTIRRLEMEVTNARSKYQQLLDARSNLAEQLDYGFKELLEDEDAAASAIRQLEALQRELSETKQRLAREEATKVAVEDELTMSKQQHEKVTNALRAKLDELYEELQRKDDVTYTTKQLERKICLLEQEKINNQGEQSALQSHIETVKSDRAQQHAKIIALQDRIAELEGKEDAMNDRVLDYERKLEGASREQSKLREHALDLERGLEEERQVIKSNQDEKAKLERKLLRERHQLEDHINKLVKTIDEASSRNEELGNKVIDLMKRIKSNESEIIGLNSQLKSEKTRTREIERAFSTLQRSGGREPSTSEELKRRVHDAESMKERYQSEVRELKRALDRTQSEKDALQRQRDQAIKRVSTLMKCQEQIQTTVESHTTELVEELEAVQAQLDDERKRCTILLANEKTLLRDITEKNAAVSRLQQSIAVLEARRDEEPLGLRKPARNQSLFPFVASPTTQDTTSTTPKTSNSSAVSSSAHELDRLLGHLERISEFSSAHSPSESFTR